MFAGSTERETTMNGRERIKGCISHSPTGEVSWQINCTKECGRRLLRDLDLVDRELLILGNNVLAFSSLDDYFGNSIVFLPTRAGNTPVEVGPGIWKDEWNVDWDRRIDRDIGSPLNCILERKQLSELIVPDPSSTERYLHLDPMIRANPGRYRLARLSYSLFERAWSLRGIENLLVDFVQDHDFVKDLFRMICDFHLAVIRNLRPYEIDGIIFGDDWATQSGLMVSPAAWRSLVLPYAKELYDQAHREGFDVFVHSCGNVTAILDDLIDSGVDVYNPFQPEAVDVRALMETHAHRICFYGGLSLQRTLTFGSAAEVQNEVLDRIALARRHGSLVISPAHHMTPDVPTSNIVAMREILTGARRG